MAKTADFTGRAVGVRVTLAATVALSSIHPVRYPFACATMEA